MPILIPLFVSSFRHAEELAVAMECRCYTGSGEGRTRLTVYELSARDWIALAVCTTVAVAAVLLNNVLIFGM